MPTQFKNELYFSDASAGELTTITTLNVWDCRASKWSNSPPVVLRNTLLFALYPNRVFTIGEISKTDTNANLLNPFKPKGNYPKQYLDLASNSRTHGRFTFCEKPIGRLYYGEDWKRIIYGSIVHTGCKKLTYLTANYAITDDENIDKDGNQYDCPPLDINFETGDSHGKANAETMQLIEDFGQTSGNPMQFRSALFGKWIGKGTVAYNTLCDDMGIDFAQPLSSMKGNKLPLGKYEGKILVGKVFTAEKRSAKGGWMLFQWFSFDTLEKDKIITRIMKRCQAIVSAYDNIQKLAKFLKIEQDAGEAQLSNPDDGFTSVAEYENMMIRIIRADKRGLLLLHPYVVRRIEQRLQSYWLNQAKSAGVKFFSVMTMPDEYFAKYYVVLKDGRISGRKVFCAPDFKQGEYIVFCNPMRHWGDVQLWTNKWEGKYLGDTGIMATGKDLLLSLGRDTDGDYVQLIPSNAYPAMRDAIKNFDPSPIVQKLPKVALTGTFQEIAIRSMNDITGIVASLLGRARGAGVEYQVLKIPAFPPYQEEDKEMRIIDFLSQELQIAVDSIKSAYPNHTKGLDVVKKYLDGVEGEIGIPWLSDFKSPDCYRNRPCAVKPDAVDTISRLVKLVNSYFTAPSLQINSDAKDYINTLFYDVQPSAFQLDIAQQHLTKYRQEMAEAIAWKEENDHDTSLIRQVAEKAKASHDKILEFPEDGQLLEPRTWVRAYWQVCHNVNSGDAGLVFLIFPDEIIVELQQVQGEPIKLVEVYGVQYSPINKPKWVWTGQDVLIRFYLKNVKGKQYKAVEMQWEGVTNPLFFGFQHLGMVGSKSRGEIALGESKKMQIFTLRSDRLGLNTGVMLFDPDYYTTDEMRQIMLKERTKGYKWR